jgi:hypothetical protein
LVGGSQSFGATTAAIFRVEEVPPRHCAKLHGFIETSNRDRIRATWPGFSSWQEQEFLLYSMWINSGDHPASYTMGMGALSLCVKQTTHLQQVLRPRIVE